MSLTEIGKELQAPCFLEAATYGNDLSKSVLASQRESHIRFAFS